MKRHGRWLGRRSVVLLATATLAACATMPAPAVLSGDDQVALGQIANYLDGLQRFQADFTQAGPDGASAGLVWLARPGRLRVEYTRPRPKVMVANRGRLLLADHLTGSTTTLPLSRTPLDILLAKTIPLSGPVTITALRRLPGELQLSLVKRDAPGQGTLTLRFAASPLALDGVVILDSHGQTTSLDLGPLQTRVAIDPARFEYHPEGGAGS